MTTIELLIQQLEKDKQFQAAGLQSKLMIETIEAVFDHAIERAKECLPHEEKLAQHYVIFSIKCKSKKMPLLDFKTFAEL